MDFNLHEFFLQTKGRGVIFCFCGPISQGVIEGIGQTLKQKMTLEEQSQSTIQKVFSVFIEQMQNVVNYSSDRIAEAPLADGDIRLGILVIGHEQDAIVVRCGNMVRTADATPLCAMLTRLQGMDKDQLKTLYKERLRQGPQNGSKGAGLGFIDMARKASRPLLFDFVPVDAGTQFFSITVSI